MPPQWAPMQPCGSLVSFRPANTGQVGAVLTVLDEVAAWLASMGVQQWPHRFDAAWVLPAIEEGLTWLVDADGLLAATITWNGQTRSGVPTTAAQVTFTALPCAGTRPAWDLNSWAGRRRKLSARAATSFDWTA